MKNKKASDIKWSASVKMNNGGFIKWSANTKMNNGGFTNKFAEGGQPPCAPGESINPATGLCTGSSSASQPVVPADPYAKLKQNERYAGLTQEEMSAITPEEWANEQLFDNQQQRSAFVAPTATYKDLNRPKSNYFLSSDLNDEKIKQLSDEGYYTSKLADGNYEVFANSDISDLIMKKGISANEFATKFQLGDAKQLQSHFQPAYDHASNIHGQRNASKITKLVNSGLSKDAAIAKLVTQGEGTVEGLNKLYGEFANKSVEIKNYNDKIKLQEQARIDAAKKYQARIDAAHNISKSAGEDADIAALFDFVNGTDKNMQIVENLNKQQNSNFKNSPSFIPKKVEPIAGSMQLKGDAYKKHYDDNGIEIKPIVISEQDMAESMERRRKNNSALNWSGVNGLINTGQRLYNDPLKFVTDIGTTVKDISELGYETAMTAGSYLTGDKTNYIDFDQDALNTSLDALSIIPAGKVAKLASPLLKTSLKTGTQVLQKGAKNYLKAMNYNLAPKFLQKAIPKLATNPVTQKSFLNAGNFFTGYGLYNTGKSIYDGSLVKANKEFFNDPLNYDNFRKVLDKDLGLISGINTASNIVNAALPVYQGLKNYKAASTVLHGAENLLDATDDAFDVYDVASTPVSTAGSVTSVLTPVSKLLLGKDYKLEQNFKQQQRAATAQYDQLKNEMDYIKNFRMQNAGYSPEFNVTDKTKTIWQQYGNNKDGGSIKWSASVKMANGGLVNSILKKYPNFNIHNDALNNYLNGGSVT
jgi:hypothetical protein